jgi:hypothetical protein
MDQCREMIALGVARPGTAERYDPDIARLLRGAEAAELGENPGACPWRARPGLGECVTRAGTGRHIDVFKVLSPRIVNDRRRIGAAWCQGSEEEDCGQRNAKLA